jgi:apolipoprotein N-acyltransferase
MKVSSVLAVLAGAAAVTGFAPFGYFVVPLAALVSLLWLWHRHPDGREAAWIGFAFGAGHFLTGVSWVYVSLYTFGMMPAPLAAIATAAFCFFLALFPAAVGLVAGPLRAGRPIVALLVVPGAWVALEWLRGWIFTGFPWLNLGYSQIDTPLAGYAPILGVYGVSLATALAAGLVWIALRPPLGARLAAVVLLAALYGVGLGMTRITWTEKAGDGLDVALLQGNIPQELKFVPGRFESTLATYLRLIEQTNAQLIVLPETAVPAFPENVPPSFLERVKAHGLKSNGDVLIGLPTGDPRGAYFNSVTSLGTAPGQSYSKSHLVPFGEFIPWGFGWIERVLSIPLSSFTPGPATQKPLALSGEKVAINICYEDAFGAQIIRQLPEATLLINVSNVAWFGNSLAPAQHLQIARMRSIETGRFMLRATNTGVTAVLDQRGRVVDALPAFSEGVLYGRVQGYQGATPYVERGDWIVLAALVLAAVGIVAGRRPRAARIAR